MGKSTSKLERGLLAIAMVLAVAFLMASLASPSPWSDLMIGMATSFVFFVVFDLILALRRFLRHRKRRSFFGSDVFETEALLVLADFELRSDIEEMLSSDQRRAPYQRPRVPGVPDHPHPMTQTTMMCLMDIRAVISIAEELAPWSALPPRITVDTDALRDRTHSFFASGLTDNHCTAMYLRDDQAPLFSIASEGIETIVTLADGHVVKNSSSQEFAVIVRYSPDPRRQPGRRWFLVAGLDEAGSAAAGHYLAQHWQDLSAIVSDGHDFVAVVGLPLHAWWEPTLTHVVSRDRAGAIITIETEVAPSIR